MGMRRRAWWLATVCIAGLAGGCASGGAARAGVEDKEQQALSKAGDEGSKNVAAGATESLIARSAAGLDRVLSGEQLRQGTRRIEDPPGFDAREAGAPKPAPASVETVVRAEAPTAPPAPVTPGAAPIAAPPTGPAPAAAAATKPGVLSGWWEAGAAASVEGQGAAPASGAKSAAPSGSFWQGSEGDESTQMRISALALCTRVEGFGKVVKVESVRSTGRAVPLLIYTQVDGFSCREQRKENGNGENEWVIELGQSVVVYRLSADGKGDVQVKVEPEQTARDVAAFKRRDHYLVQRIELPTPLVSGKYAVKVTVRDKRTGMVDEKVAEVVVR